VALNQAPATPPRGLACVTLIPRDARCPPEMSEDEVHRTFDE